ncbi:DUF6259 domain-containing protein [Paenibacillus eucommiae]|uniref:DUF6259 domain-containing protein n=1 Tax=Paenibacillus eucommiae TaxID=1355755 RepID=A0ABS4J3S4_9BACL|nr:DUF6259 domain-containing protein [Paenibacillus eucommiae]MBP1994492.1 hypothetical protein [Paenibacillus eucommiae]
MDMSMSIMAAETKQMWKIGLESTIIPLGVPEVTAWREQNQLTLRFSDITKLALHLPTHSGIRLDHTFNHEQLPLPGHYSCPIGVIEYEGRYFTLFDPEDKTDMEVYSGQRGWEWVWRTEENQENLVLIWGQAESLAECVALYRTYRPAGIVNKEFTAPIKRIITLDMMLSSGEISHRFDDATALINDLASRQLAEGTLIYIPGWCGPYDKDYPNYQPSEQLGGEYGFTRMVETAKLERACIMPHMNYWGYDPGLQLFDDKQLMEMQLRDEHGEPAGWAGPTSPFIYMRPDHLVWQNVLLEQISSFLAKYDVQAIMLDQIGFEIKDKRCDYKTGTNQILSHIRKLRPQLIISGETLNDELISQVNLIQLWGMPWCGLDVDLTAFTSPLIKELFPEVAFYGHLGLPAISEGKYTWTNHEYLRTKGIEAAFYAAQKHLQHMGGIPHVRLHDGSKGLDPISLNYLQSL